MNSLVLNFFIVHYILDKHLVPADWAVALYLGTAIWVAWVGLARVYMGLHTPIDIGAGALLGTLVLIFYLAVDGKSYCIYMSIHGSVKSTTTATLLDCAARRTLILLEGTLLLLLGNPVSMTVICMYI